MKNTTFLLYCIFVLTFGCRDRNSQEDKNHYSDLVEYKNTDPDKIYFLDFEQNLKEDKVDTFFINNLAKEITFIPLEVSSKSLLRGLFFNVARIDDSYYISSGGLLFGGIMVFDTLGLFKNYLVQVGRGPSELISNRTWSYNSNARQLVALGSYQILLHSFERDETTKYPLAQFIGEVCQLNDGNLVGLPNTFGTENSDTPYLCFLNQEGEIIKSLYYSSVRNISYNLQENQGNIGDLEFYGLYPSYSGDALFKDIFNDTIYRVSNINDIRPYIILNRGFLAPNVKNGTNKAETAKTVIIRELIETEKYFFIKYTYNNLNHAAIWDKRSQTFIANIEADFSNENFQVITNKSFTRYKTPSGRIIVVAVSSYMDGKLYCILEAAEAMEFLPSIMEDDNPVLMVIDIK